MSTQCPHCKTCAKKIEGIVKRNNVPIDAVKMFFLEVSESTAREVETFYDEQMNGTRYPFTVLSPDVFLPVTSGSMPTMLLSENGSIVKEFDCINLDETHIRYFFLSEQQ